MHYNKNSSDTGVTIVTFLVVAALSLTAFYGISRVYDTYTTERKTAVFKVDSKEVLYSSGEDRNRFYRVIAKNGHLFKIRDGWSIGVRRAGGIYARIKEGCTITVKVLPEKGWYRKYPLITKFIRKDCK